MFENIDTMHVSRLGGLGDILLCTPALRSLKEKYPLKNLEFYGNYLHLLKELPFIDKLHDYYTDKPPLDAITLSYEGRVKDGRHFAQVIGDCVGVEVVDVRPECFIDLKLVDDYRSKLSAYPRPWIVVNRRASTWTPNKNWPNAMWEELILRLKGSSTTIEIGSRPEGGEQFNSRADLDLMGKTDLFHLVSVVAASDLVVSPVSGPIHIAAACKTPAVVIAGGYEPPQGTFYPGNTMLSRKPECSPCWLREPCPYDRKCLSDITVDEVFRSIFSTVRINV
jgi:ADP-heptose:LPS heptosyltransferase